MKPKELPMIAINAIIAITGEKQAAINGVTGVPAHQSQYKTQSLALMKVQASVQS
jgi:hypothetical protein